MLKNTSAIVQWYFPWKFMYTVVKHGFPNLQFMACPNKGIKIHTFVVDCFYISLFSALEQTNCTLVASDSKWVTFLLCVLNIYPSGVFTALAGAMWNYCCLSTFCVHHTTMHHATSFHAKPHMSGACVFSYNPTTCTFGRMTGIFYMLLQ